jgi:hypothetical protein
VLRTVAAAGVVRIAVDFEAVASNNWAVVVVAADRIAADFDCRK